jgi:hypothetical protein
MRKVASDDHSVESQESADQETGKVGSMFQRLFAPLSADTSVSSDSDDDRSLGSNDSTISGSSSESGQSSCSSMQSIQRFDRELRAKHRRACKNMTVSDSKNGNGGSLVLKFLT